MYHKPTDGMYMGLDMYRYGQVSFTHQQRSNREPQMTTISFTTSGGSNVTLTSDGHGVEANVNNGKMTLRSVEMEQHETHGLTVVSKWGNPVRIVVPAQAHETVKAFFADHLALVASAARANAQIEARIERVYKTA